MQPRKFSLFKGILTLNNIFIFLDILHVILDITRYIELKAPLRALWSHLFDATDCGALVDIYCLLSTYMVGVCFGWVRHSFLFGHVNVDLF